jgi:hypothetical protein
MAVYQLPAVEPAELIAYLQREILRADTTQIARQIAAWRGMMSGSDILEGMDADRMLALSEIRLSFHVDRYPPAFWRRLWVRILNWLRGSPSRLWLVGSTGSRSSKQVFLTAERNEEGDWIFHLEPDLEELRRDYGLTALG